MMDSHSMASTKKNRRLVSWKSPDGRYSFCGYSRAADATFFYVPEYRLQLDMGGFDKGFARPNAFFLTHGHLDHSVCAHEVRPAAYEQEHQLRRQNECERRASSKQNEKKIATTTRPLFVPAEVSSLVRDYLEAGRLLNDGNVPHRPKPDPYRLVSVSHGEKHLVDERLNLHVEVVRCVHGVPTVGYLFFERRLKLKSEFLGLVGTEIARLRREGISVQEAEDVYLFGFMGDTTPEVFDENPEILRKVKTLVVECTHFGEGTETHARNSYHTHWNDLEKVVAANPNVHFLLTHFSRRYEDVVIEAFFETAKKRYSNIDALV